VPQAGEEPQVKRLNCFPHLRPNSTPPAREAPLPARRTYSPKSFNIRSRSIWLARV